MKLSELFSSLAFKPGIMCHAVIESVYTIGSSLAECWLSYVKNGVKEIPQSLKLSLEMIIMLT